MGDVQRILLVGLLMMVGAAMAFVLLNFGEGAFSRGTVSLSLFCPVMAKNSITGPGYGLYTKKGIPGILFGLISPIGLFVVAVSVALCATTRD